MSAPKAFEQLLTTPELAPLGPGPRAGVQAEAALNRALTDIFSTSKLPRERQQLIRALILLWHDHLDTSHEIAQAIENSDGAFVHGIMHRREPDYGNAKYWFHRVHQHGAFPEIADRVKVLLEEKGDPTPLVTPNGQWDPFAFVDYCEKLSRSKNVDAQEQLLREVQKIETDALLNWFCR